MANTSLAALTTRGHQTSAGQTASRTIAGVAQLLLPRGAAPSFAAHTLHLYEVSATKSPYSRLSGADVLD